MSRGGMCRNPFGGRTRLDRLNLMELLETNAPQEKILFLQTITDAIHNYLFFGLGRNGTTAQEFAYACEYLFRVRACAPETWNMEVQAGKKRRTSSKQNLSDSQYRSMCFDIHYEYSGLSTYMPLDRFVSWLKQERRHLLDENAPQVAGYMLELYFKACEQASLGHQLPLPIFDYVDTLVCPKTPTDVARLVFLPKKYLNPPTGEVC
jgi:hypothetical protein